MHGSILPVTIPSPGPTPGDLQFFLTWQSIPHPRAHRMRRFPTPLDSSSTTNTLFCVQNLNDDIDFRTIANKPDVLTRT